MTFESRISEKPNTDSCWMKTCTGSVRVWEERATGIAGAIERWGYCKEHWDEMLEIRRALSDCINLYFPLKTN